MAPPGFLSMSLGLSAALFVCYCVYFDRKRRSSPDFRKRLYERRRRMRTTTSPSPMSSSSSTRGPRGGDKPASSDTYFLTEMRAGEELITQGYIDEGLSHFANAVALCGHPDKVMEALQATLPGQMFELLISKLKGLQGISDAGGEDWSEERLSSSTHEL